MKINNFAVGLVLVAILVTGSSVYLISGSNNAAAIQGNAIPAVPTTYSYPRNSSTGGLIEHVNATTGRLDGCNVLASQLMSQGYSLKVYVSSLVPNAKDALCVTAIFRDETATPLSLNESLGLRVSISVTNSAGHEVFGGICVPSRAPASYYETHPLPQFLQCAALWDTTAPVNGATLQSGTYHVNVSGFLITAGAPSQTSVTIISEVNVALSTG
jgi:hypothetical protein